jgi:nitrogen regulatory protein P-II 1
MKKIEAIIRKTKFDQVKEALHEVGIDFFSYWDVRGHGSARQERIYRGVMYDTSVIERTKLSFVVRDKYLKSTVEAILKSASTGEIGDGKIFVSNIEESYRIRTGESGDESLFISE